METPSNFYCGQGMVPRYCCRIGADSPDGVRIQNTAGGPRKSMQTLQKTTAFCMLNFEIRSAGLAAEPSRSTQTSASFHSVLPVRSRLEAFIMISATQIRRGMVIKLDNDLFTVMTVQHITPGNWRGMVQTKLRNLRSGKQSERRFRSEESVERITLDSHELEYLYSDGNDYHFMNMETYEQVTLGEDLLGDNVYYLISNTKVEAQFYEGSPISVELPSTVDLVVVDTEPGVRSATVTNVTKAAKLETGLVVQVPQFISTGERIRIDTTEGKYLQRA
jgi:elongation factor P